LVRETQTPQERRKFLIMDSNRDDPKEESLSASSNHPKMILVDSPQASEPFVALERFSDLPVPFWLLQALETLGVERPTPIQRATLLPGLSRRDVIGCAPTGSGKTLCYVIPILADLAQELFGVHSVVLTPTRELALQIADQFRVVGAPLKLRVHVMVGGTDLIESHLEVAHRIPHVVVATPGRLAAVLQHTTRITSGADVCVTPLSLKRLRTFVLDEADRLLSSDFVHELQVILSYIPPSRQTLLFSATMTKNLNKLAALALSRPFRFDASPKFQTVKTLTQEYILTRSMMRECYVMYLLNEYLSNPKTITRGADSQLAIVFVANCTTCELLTEMLCECDIAAVSLHSGKAQHQRAAALTAFRSGLKRVLVATDVASRGLDIPHVGLVISHNVPRDYKDYLHRVGRTARFGHGTTRHEGCAVTLVTEHDVCLIQHIEQMLGVKLTERLCDEREVLRLLNQALTAKQIAFLKLEEGGFFLRQKEKKKKKLEVRFSAITTQNAKLLSAFLSDSSKGNNRKESD